MGLLVNIFPTSECNICTLGEIVTLVAVQLALEGLPWWCPHAMTPRTYSPRGWMLGFSLCISCDWLDCSPGLSTAVTKPSEWKTIIGDSSIFSALAQICGLSHPVV